MKSRLVFTLMLGVLFIIGSFWWLLNAWQDESDKLSALPSICDDVLFEGSHFLVCTVEPATTFLALHLSDSDDKPWRSLQRLADFQRGNGTPFTFAMNAGMYHEDLSPVGLHIESSKIIVPLNTEIGEGNFFLKPNGVFGMTKNGTPFILDTVAYLNAAIDPVFATQSGPMLVIDGQIHPRFEPDGKSRFTRNGVGITEGRKLIFAISRGPVSFGTFARLFLQQFKCRNALYFDGVVSAFSDSDSIIEGGGYPAGPIVSITVR